MTAKIFWRDPYLTRLETRVVSVDGNDVTLAETFFFAESGGQESDQGTIAGDAVRAARLRGHDIVYTLSEGHELTPGQTVVIEIDWARRYRLMRLHFAAELVLELVYRDFPGTAKTGAHIAADKARIDFAWRGNIAAILPGIASETAAIVDADQVILSAFSDEADQRRYWRIGGFAEVPCGGTHLRRTGEVGEVRLKRKNPGKGRERIEITLAEPNGRPEPPRP